MNLRLVESVIQVSGRGFLRIDFLIIFNFLYWLLRLYSRVFSNILEMRSFLYHWMCHLNRCLSYIVFLRYRNYILINFLLITLVIHTTNMLREGLIWSFLFLSFIVVHHCFINLLFSFILFIEVLTYLFNMIFNFIFLFNCLKSLVFISSNCLVRFELR